MNQMAVAINSFDRSKPFYPLIMSYVAQLLSYRELALWGVMKDMPFAAIASNFVENLFGKNDEHEKAKIKKSLLVLREPLKLACEKSNTKIEINFNEIASELSLNSTYLFPYFYQAAGFLLVLAHELNKDRSYNDKGPLWEFLRHCRNAVAHGGNFHFNKHEPSRPANWGPFLLDKSFDGTLLFKNELKNGLLSPGDPIWLLWDIEQAYPVMSI